MKRFLLVFGVVLLVVLLVSLGTIGWYLHTKQAQRSGMMEIAHLGAPVTVRYDERGVPHIEAANEVDGYRALGFVHAQDRLFQMELMRRLANGDLAEIFGAKLLDTDQLFRTIGIREYAERYAANMDLNSPSSKALIAYLDGVNQYQSSHALPVEFDMLHIQPRPFTPEDTVAISGYLAYSFAAAFKTEPVMTFIRDKLGPEYLNVFDTEWHPLGVLDPEATAKSPLDAGDWQSLDRVASVSRHAIEMAGLPMFQGSNAWVLSGKLTESGKPLLAGDPHIGFSAPAVWYEAHLTYPGFDLYGHFMALTPFALLGHNGRFGWSFTMFENDDIDMVAERTNPANPNQVWQDEQWKNMSTRTEIIQVKDAAPVQLRLRRSSHGPIITDAFKDSFGRTPIAMWWAFYETENLLFDALYELNRADTRSKARVAAEKIHAPGLNLMWANAAGDIAWWAAAKLPQRPAGVNPMFILDAAKGEADKPGFYNFSFNPQEENPSRGYIVSANNQPTAGSGVPVPGYYLLPDRVQRLKALIENRTEKWNADATKVLQLDVCNGYPKRVLKLALPLLESVVTDANEKAFLEPLQKWDGCFTEDSIAATLFSQFSYELAKAAFADELGPTQFANLLGTPALDHALPLLLADAKSPWWNNVDKSVTVNRFEVIRIAWTNTINHLSKLYGTTLTDWTWGKTHTLTLTHPLGNLTGLGWIFNIGPFAVPGGRETPNNFSQEVGPAPWKVSYGPSTRRIIDFGHPDKAQSISPSGQSGVPWDHHYSDQSEHFVSGIYAPMHLDPKDVEVHTENTLTLNPP
jgi:penicillin amidase